jgi:hypothetical protein
MYQLILFFSIRYCLSGDGQDAVRFELMIPNAYRALTT